MIEAGPPAGFGALAASGLRAAEPAGVVGNVERSSSPAGDGRALRACVEGGAGLVIAVGPLVENAVDAIAVTHPAQRFAVVDGSIQSLTHRPPNVTGLIFKAEQAGYLAGYGAGLWLRANRVPARRIAGAVGGLDVPPTDRYLAGFRYGVLQADPKAKVQIDFAEGAGNRSDCAKTALDEIHGGAAVVLAAADGACAEGILGAVRTKHSFAVVTDTEPASAGAWLLGSAVKRVDVVVRAAILAYRAGRLHGGTDIPYGVAQDGVGYGAWSPVVPGWIRRAVANRLRLLKAGRLGVVPAALS